jgi:hypothetical protein
MEMDINLTQYGIWCTVRGGPTGHREAWLKHEGELFQTSSESYAERIAEHYQAQAAKHPGPATFSYTVRQLD